MAIRKRHRTATATGVNQKGRPRRARGLPGIPEWEATKGNSRNLSHHEAVNECAQLSAQYRRMWCHMSPIQVDLDRILHTLRTKRVPFVLTGAHGISSWTGRPRATKDVDILVKPGRNLTRAIKAIRALYSELEVRQFAGVTAFFVPGEKESVIDVTYPHRADLAVTLQTAIWIEEGTKKYRIPTLEAALANKYGAMLTLTRDPLKRGQDALDFATMVRHSTDEGRQPIDLPKLTTLGEKVWPGGGGDEILRLVDQAKAGTIPSIASLAQADPRDEHSEG